MREVLVTYMFMFLNRFFGLFWVMKLINSWPSNFVYVQKNIFIPFGYTLSFTTSLTQPHSKRILLHPPQKLQGCHLKYLNLDWPESNWNVQYFFFSFVRFCKKKHLGDFATTAYLILRFLILSCNESKIVRHNKI